MEGDKMTTYWRTSRQTGAIDEITAREAQLAIADRFLFEVDLQRGVPVTTPFSVITNYNPAKDSSHLAYMAPESQPLPNPGHNFDNGSILLAIKRQRGFRTWFYVLCWIPDRCEYVVWGLNREDGLFYFGDYFEGFEEAANTFNAKE